MVCKAKRNIIIVPKMVPVKENAEEMLGLWHATQNWTPPEMEGGEIGQD
jgi:hypothetical protein